MKYNISNYRLNVIIDELGDEYKELLIENILEEMNEIDVDKINPLDMIRLDVATKSSLRNRKKIQKKERLTVTLYFLGMIYAMIGLFIMMLSEFSVAITRDSGLMISVILIFIGLVITIVSLMFKTMIKNNQGYNRGESNSIKPYEIINKWKEIEALVYEITPQKDEFSLFEMIDSLKDAKIISEQDVKTIEELLKMRNAIAHNRVKINSFYEFELREMIIRSNILITKMKKMV